MTRGYKSLVRLEIASRGPTVYSEKSRYKTACKKKKKINKLVYIFVRILVKFQCKLVFLNVSRVIRGMTDGDTLAKFQ